MRKYRLALIIACAMVLCMAAAAASAQTATGTNYIKGMVYNDTDHDGALDATETGIPGLTVNLVTTTGDPEKSLITDHNGWFCFTGLTDGQYIVYVILPPGYVFTSPSSVAIDLDGTFGHSCFYAYLAYQPQFSQRTIGYWKNHPDAVSPLLPVWLGTAGGPTSIKVTSVGTAVSILSQSGGASNGIVKLKAQLLATKLNIAAGSDGSSVAGAIAKADYFLSTHDEASWKTLSASDKQYVLSLKDTFDAYNNAGE